MFRKPLIYLLIPALFLISLFSPNGAAGGTGSGKVVATILPLYIFTANITHGIDGIEVELLMDGENADPHFYTLTIKDLEKLASARVLIANGKVEEFLDLGKVRESNRELEIIQTQVVSASAPDLPEVKGNNPHTWISPKRSIAECEAIAKGLIEAFPGIKDSIWENLKVLKGKLRSMSDMVEASLREIGPLGLVTFHDGLDIFAADFGIEIIGHIEETRGIPPSPKQLSALVKKIIRFEGKVLIVSDAPSPDDMTKGLSNLSGSPVTWFDPVIVGEKSLTYYEEVIKGNMKRLIDSFKM